MNIGVFLWKFKINNFEKFYFKVIDECNVLLIFEMIIEIVVCFCMGKGICRFESNYFWGLGMYVCEC